jgi:hypothetical protein
MVATAALRALGPPGIWYFFILVAAAFATFVAWRARRRARPSETEQEHFHTMPASPQIPEWNPYWHEEDPEAATGERSEQPAR